MPRSQTRREDWARPEIFAKRISIHYRISAEQEQTLGSADYLDGEWASWKVATLHLYPTCLRPPMSEGRGYRFLSELDHMERGYFAARRKSKIFLEPGTKDMEGGELQHRVLRHHASDY